MIKPTSYTSRALLKSLFFILSSTNAGAQEILSIQLDIAGASPYGSLNIEKNIFRKNNLELKIKSGIGFAFIDVVEPPRTYIKPKPTIPFGINLLFGNGKRPNNFEIGLQGTLITEMTIPELWDPDWIYRENIKNKVLSSFFVGYRFRPIKRNGLIRIGYNPILLNGKIISWGVLSLGWTFIKSNEK